MSSGKSLGQEIYSGSATFGKIEAWISAVIGTLIGLGLLIVGIVLVSHKTSLTKRARGTIKSAYCLSSEANNQKSYNCTLDVEYIVKKQTYNIIDVISSKYDYQPHDHDNTIIDVYYNPKSPKSGKLKSDNNKVIGIILIIIGIIIPAGTWLWVWVTYKSKFAAAAGGVAAASGMIFNR